MIVLDASVIIKWVLTDEQLSGAALGWRDRHVSGEDRIAVPELLFYEIGNVFATKTPLSAGDAVEGLSLIADSELDAYTLGMDEFTEAIRLSKHFKISLYDSSYLALAAALGCEMITADARLVSRVKQLRYCRLLQ